MWAVDINKFWRRWGPLSHINCKIHCILLFIDIICTLIYLYLSSYCLSTIGRQTFCSQFYIYNDYNKISISKTKLSMVIEQTVDFWIKWRVRLMTGSCFPALRTKLLMHFVLIFFIVLVNHYFTNDFYINKKFSIWNES